MRIFLDTEFTGLHQNTTLISIGLVADSGHEFYAELTDYDKHQLENWHLENVIPNLIYGKGDNKVFPDTEGVYTGCRGDSRYIASLLKDWLRDFWCVEVWSDTLAYDWVLFCQLFGGGAECLPENVCYIPFDLATLLKVKGIDPDISREGYAGMDIDGAMAKHNAIWDARVIKACYDKIMSKEL